MNEREQEIFDKSVDLLVRELNPTRIYLFGSRGKGEARQGSDFDFAIDCPPPERRKTRMVKDILEAIAGLYSVDIVFLPEVDPDFKKIILDTGKIVYDENTMGHLQKKMRRSQPHVNPRNPKALQPSITPRFAAIYPNHPNQGFRLRRALLLRGLDLLQLPWAGHRLVRES